MERAEHDALGIPDFKHRRRDRLASDIDRGLSKIRRLPHRGAKGIALPVTSQQLEPLHSSIGLNRQSRIRSKILVARNERRQTSQPVSRELRPAAVRIQQLHRRATIAEAVQEQPVGTNPMVPMTHGTSESGQIATSLVSGSAQEIVPVGVRLHDTNGRHHGI